MFNKLRSLFAINQRQRDEIRHEINLFEAVKAHTRWKNRLVDYLDGTSNEVLRPQEICLDNRCELGIWIHGYGKRHLANQPLFQHLVEEHAKFHLCAAKVVEAHLLGDKKLAQQYLSENFIEQSRKTMKYLAKLNAEITGETQAMDELTHAPSA